MTTAQEEPGILPGSIEKILARSLIGGFENARAVDLPIYGYGGGQPPPRAGPPKRPPPKGTALSARSERKDGRLIKNQQGREL